MPPPLTPHPPAHPPLHLLRAALVVLAVLLLHALALALLMRYGGRPGPAWPAPIRTQFVNVLQLAPPGTLTLVAPVRTGATTAALSSAVVALPAAAATSAPATPLPAAPDPARRRLTGEPTGAPQAKAQAVPAQGGDEPVASPRPLETQAPLAAVNALAPLPPLALPVAPASSANAADGHGAAAAADTSAAASSANAPDAGAPGPEWPLSTQLRYTLSGEFRGPLHGAGQVQWLRDGAHYQVRVDVTVDPGLGRSMVSEGRITAAGLVPARYVEDTRLLFESAVTNRLAIDGGTVALPRGRSAAAPSGLQDSASQFVQLTWLLRTGRLAARPGEVVTLPLALPDRVGPWSYVVGAPERVELPFATVEAIPLTPTPASMRPSDWPAQVWVAPSLQHLPVRIRIQAGPEISVDLRLAELPRQAAPSAPR